MLAKFLNGRSENILSAALVIGIAGVGSRLLGVLRERLLSARFGAGPEVDAYAAAFRIPDALFGLFIIGAIATAFIPVFADYLNQKKAAAEDLPSLREKPEALAVAVSVLNIITLAIGALALLAFTFTPWLISLIAPGFAGDRQEMTVLLTRLMLLQPIILGVSSVVGAILQTYRHFVAYALAPVFYNVGLIIGIVLLVPLLGVAGLGLGVVLAALLHLVVQLPALPATGFRWQPALAFRQPGVIKIFKLMLPRALGIAGEQINLIVLTAIASTLAVGSNAIMYYADNIRALPTGIIGVAFSVAVFPLLAFSAAVQNRREFGRSLADSLRHVLYFVIPLALALYLLRAHVTRIIIGTDKLSWEETMLAIATVGTFCWTIIFQAVVPLLAKAFYALKDTLTPVIVALASAGVTIASAFFFVSQFAGQAPWTLKVLALLRLPVMPGIEVIALPLAFGAAAIFQAGVLGLLVVARLKGAFRLKSLARSLAKVVIATAALGMVLLLTRNFLAPLAEDPDLKTTVGLFFQAGFAALAGFVTFLLVSAALKAEEIKEFLKLWPGLKK